MIVGKIRAGFISNSSSSSFCLYGIHLSDDKTENFIKENFSDNEKIMKCLESYDSYELEYFINNDERFKGLKILIGSEDLYSYIGRDFTSIGDNETGKEFKESVQENVKKFFKNEKCRIHEGEIER